MTATIEQTVLKVPIARIKADPEQPRKHFDKDSLYRLGLSLKKGGQRQPGILKKIEGDPKHDYIIVDGERRWRAAKLAGLSLYRAILSTTQTREQQFEESIISNFGREEHTHLEIANAIVRLRSESKMTIEEIADSLAKTPSYVFQHLSLLKLDEGVRAMLDETLPEEQQLKYSIAINIIAKIEDKKRQVEVAQHIVANHLNLYEARTYADRIGRANGFTTRRSKPSDDLPVLQNFVKRLLSDSEFVMNLRHADFSAILQAESIFRVRDLESSLRSAIENLEIIRGAVKTVIEKKDEKIKDFTRRSA